MNPKSVYLLNAFFRSAWKAIWQFALFAFFLMPLWYEPLIDFLEGR